MNYTLKIIFDDELHELFKDEGITVPMLQEEIHHFVDAKCKDTLNNEICNFVFPFVTPDGKRYSLYGNYHLKGEILQFEIELLGVSLKQ
ncbi:hypothetical protein BD780_003492 [Clostridium tetanomorphum]|uniref:hypothetical protein n=1 Tax=Clostridium tetanomorphum TaxID=1553 RepID=UPI000445FF3D|nr:hypothetical protein [Clostridium tetanomorphum]KAJ49381.1 hypothetical protein CTM_23474 [Clostridium tetanomorphum DSM 665]KAJ51220.1 hypothetical protein CTM_13908 [Clostridium tetanomorphum DSM 665]MBP1863691.1 hypothetical protein [Clostridium tetanomorphum]NRS86267.1 hypothetical protein [Clostridium tetanomorphum]SQC00725.1 Uncharacterised protein [Clostridium tetanomorphum]